MPPFIAFEGPRRIASGSAAEVALALWSTEGGPFLIFDFETGAPVDFDLSGSPADVAARYREAERGPGRPKLGVVAREVTLLPRHWDWLNAQRGGASAALRRLVDVARAADAGATEAAAAKAAAYRFLSAMAGDLPNFEEAARALFADEDARLRALMQGWPKDVAAVACERLSEVSPARNQGVASAEQGRPFGVN